MVQKFYIPLQIMVLQPCHHFISIIPSAFLTCGISVGEKVFFSEFYCGIPHVDVQTVLYR